MNYSPIFVSLIPNLMGGEGHIIPYHFAITEATKILGWQHQVFYSSEDNLPILPPNWEGNLQGNKLETDSNLFVKLYQMFIFALTINKSIKTIILDNNSSQKIVIFIERFVYFQLFSLWLSLLFLPKNNLYIWVLYRHNYHQYKTNFIYKICNKLLKFLVKKSHFNLFSDSELLANSMAKYFKEPLTVMPIPHTEFVEKKENNSYNIICWWAGPPRQEKGWDIIKNLINFDDKRIKNMTLVASKSSNLISINQGIKIILTEDNLSREDYIAWLEKTDIMLIPYDSIAYQERTSGVFTESIIAGNIPLTTKNTWMAKELLKFGLDQLIIDWDNPLQVWEKIIMIINCQEIKTKLQIMQQAYRDFHNLDNFAQIFKKTIEQKVND